jgi:hypothetical protein
MQKSQVLPKDALGLGSILAGHGFVVVGQERLCQDVDFKIIFSEINDILHVI